MFSLISYSSQVTELTHEKYFTVEKNKFFPLLKSLVHASN